MTLSITIYGAGAVGCTFAAHLSTIPPAIASLTLIGRGEHLHAIRRNGLHYIEQDKARHIAINATDNPTSLDKQDIIFLCTKAHQLPTLAPTLQALLKEESIVIPVCNGIPWWLLYGLTPAHNNNHIPLLDPQRALADTIALPQIIGAVTYMGAAIESPGKVINHASPFLQLGNPSTQPSSRMEKCDKLLKKSTLSYSVSSNIYISIFNKLCWNIAFNCLSILHQADSQTMANDTAICTRARALMKEVEHIAQSYNIPFTVDVDKHIHSAQKAGAHKPSMLQDYEQHKALETDAILFAPHDLAKRQHLDTTAISALCEDMQNFLANTIPGWCRQFARV